MPRWIAFLVALLVASGWIPTGAAQETPRVMRVVILHSGEALSPYYRAVDQALREAFRDEIRAGAQFYSEYADVARFAGDAEARKLADFLRMRYAGKAIDLVFATEPVALGFASRYRDEIFPGVPVVFMNVRQSTLSRLPLPAGFIGVPAEISPEQTIELALQLFPEASNLVIVSGADDLGRIWERLWHAAATRTAPALPVQSLSGLPLDTIERTLGGLDKHAIVLSGSFFRDGAGRFHGDTWQVLQRLRAASGAPIFSHLQQAVGRGAMGSVSVPPEIKAAEAAALGKQILAGTPPHEIVVPSPAKGRPYVDWRELVRWNVDERRLPQGSEVLFRTPTFWDTYRYHVLGVAALILAQTLLIVALLVQRARRHRAERALRESHAELGRLSRLSALGEFAATIAHEIRQPLTAIIMNARSCLREIAAVEPTLPEVRAALIDVVAAGERAEEVLQRNRRLFRDHSVETKPLDINGVIRESLAMLDTRIARSGVSLDTELADALPTVHGDRIELQQVLLNLVANALDALESGAATSRRIRLSSCLQAGQVRVSVADNGIGLDDVDPERIFTLSYTTKSSGTGVGLSISRSIVEAHGGQLWAERAAGGGAIFHFTIPLPEAGSSAAATPLLVNRPRPEISSTP